MPRDSGWFVSPSHSILALADISHSCSGITAYGGPGGPVAQLSDGQNRIGDDSLPHGQYCLDGSGGKCTLLFISCLLSLTFRFTGFTDSQGRGCILTPPTTQWQCDVGAPPTNGFTIGCNGTISHGGEDTFYACPTGNNGGFNIYSEPVKGEPGCVPIWLVADSCQKDCVKTSTITAPCTTTTTPPAAKATCPGTLSGNWEVCASSLTCPA